MKKLYRLYTFSLSGAAGGLIASLLHQYFLLDTLAGQLKLFNRYGYLAALGGLIGLSIGFFPTFVEGKGNYTLRGAIRTGILGAILGGLSGVIALPLSEWLHVYLGGGLKGRIIGWVTLGALMGTFVGIAEGKVGGARPWRGILGGIIGGGLAGIALEVLLTYRETHTNSGIFALVLLGLFISLFIALFVNLLSDAWLEGQSGKVSGQIYHLGKFREPAQAFLGCAEKNVFIYIPDAEKTHAAITLTSRGARLQHLADQGLTRVNGTPIKEHMLQDGESIEIAGATLKYRERRKTTALTALPENLKKGIV